MEDHKAIVDASRPLLDHIPKQKEVNGVRKENNGILNPSLFEGSLELKQLFVIAFPMIITGLLTYGKSAIAMFFMGKLGKEALAGGSLFMCVANITGYSILSGLATGMEPICAQACGAQTWPVMGQTLLRTISLLLLVCIPISVLWLNIEPILLLCGQDPTVSAIAATYLAFSIPDLIFVSFIHPLKIYLRTQKLTSPLMLSAFFSLAFHALINYILVCRFHLGIKGIALSGAFMNFVLLISLFWYSCSSEVCQKSWQWPKWSMPCFKEWKMLLSLAFPSCISVCIEWWWYEIMILLSGWLPNETEALASMGILIQATSFLYIFPSALSLAVSTRVGNELGANQPSRARTSFLIAFMCAICNGLLAMFFMIMMENVWGHAFTNNEAILSLTAAVMKVAALCELGNCPQTAGCGILRGSARPSMAMSINLGSFYGVGFPVALFMGRQMEMGLPGLWMGLLSAQVVCAMAMIVVLIKTDWVEQAKRGKELIGADNVDYEAQKITILES